ncbi:heavy metal translocating P-type ATPase [Caldisericum sp. AR60]|uniref:heavy metal translocating P-type ATPase n=1 Tax=Caldisericum sp. AR60 TaxID=3397852 RepID=UPI0039FCF5D3
MIKTKTLDVKGMHCASCAVNVKKAIEKSDGIIDVNVNIATNKATIIYDPTKTKFEEVLKNVERIGYSLNEEIDQQNSDFNRSKTRIIVATITIIPIVVLMILDMTNILKFSSFTYINLILSGIMIFGIGFEVQKRALKGLIHGATNMDLLIFLGTVASFLTGILKTFGLNIADFSYVGAMIMFFHLLGKYLEELAKGNASKAIKGLLDISPQKARIIVDGMEVETNINELDVDDVMVIRPFEKIPTDGIIIEGNTSVDESMVTGEYLPVDKKPGDEVIGGTINENGFIKVKVTKVGNDTFLAKLISLAQGSKIPIQAFADKIVAFFVPAVVAIAIFTFVIWFIIPQTLKQISMSFSHIFPWINPGLNKLSAAIFASVATLVIACPCALGLATPIALMVGSGIGAKNGILIRNGEAIQKMKDVNTIIFDKTGTLTYGKPKISHMFKLDEECEDIIAAIERFSNHPVAKAFQEVKTKKQYQVEDFKEISGLGVSAKINGTTFTAKKVSSSEIADKNILSALKTFEQKGETVIGLFKENEIVGIFGIEDTIKETAKSTLNKLKEMGFEIIMITGDNKIAASKVAKEPGIENFYAEVHPKDKLEIVKKAENLGKIVVFVGDGVNDAPALKQANVGIAMGTGTDIAIESGDIILVKGNIENVVKAIILSKQIFAKIKQNLFWALFYNIIAIPIASLGLLHPVIAEIAMALSSINVITNSLRLNSLKF